LQLERRIRRLVKEKGSVTIYTGGCYLAEKEGDKKYVKYQLIGKHNVSVPTHFYKVVFAKDNAAAWIVPNKPIEDQPLENYRTTIKKIEAVAGVIFPKS